MGRSLDIIPGLFHQLGQLELHLLLPLTAHSQEGEVHEDHVRTNPNLGMPTLSFLTSVTANRCRLVASIIPFVHILSGDQFFSVLIAHPRSSPHFSFMCSHAKMFSPPKSVSTRDGQGYFSVASMNRS